LFCSATLTHTTKPAPSRDHRSCWSLHMRRPMNRLMLDSAYPVEMRCAFVGTVVDVRVDVRDEIGQCI
jgi:hypothetical protein